VKFRIENIFCCFIIFYKTNQCKIYKQWINAKNFRCKISHIGKRLQHYLLRNFIIDYMCIIDSVLY